MPQAAVIPVIARRGYLRGAKETTWGTAAAATFDLPTHTRDIQGTLTKDSVDVALNTRSRDFIIVNGRRFATGRLGGPAFGTSFGNVLMGALGTDTVSANPAAPTGVAAVASASGGTLGTATQFYKVTAVSATGETLPSSEVSAATTGPNASVKITWSEVPGAIGYNVYGRVTATELKILPATSPFVGAGAGFQVTVPGGVTQFVDTGAATPAGALPVSNTFGNRHLFTPANVLPSYTFEQNRGGFGSSQQYSGCIFGRLDLASKFDQNDGVLDWTAQILGAFETTPPIAATAFNKPADKPAVAPKCSAAYGGLSWAKVMEFSCSINNTPQEIKVANSTLDINNAIATTLEVKGSARIVFDAFTAAQSAQAIGEFTDWYQNNGLTLAFTWPFEDNAVAEFQAKSAILSNYNLKDSGPQYVEASFDFIVQDPVTNLAIALVNGQVGAY